MDYSGYVSELESTARSDGTERLAAAQILQLYRFAASRPEGTFLELGTDTGIATKAILAACGEIGGNLVSVDLLDCSQVAESDSWTFVQANSIDRETICAKAPALATGIDMIYVDSAHNAGHVSREIQTWYPLLKVGGAFYFDDVDSRPYETGGRKNNPLMALSNRSILGIVQEYFYLNMDSFDLSICLGSSGLAKLTKISNKSDIVAPKIRERSAKIHKTLAKIRMMFGGNYYYHGNI